MQIDKFKADDYVKRLDHFLKNVLISESRSKIEKYISFFPNLVFTQKIPVKSRISLRRSYSYNR